MGLAYRYKLDEIEQVDLAAQWPIAARWYGYTTVWINRTGAPPEQLDTDPDHVGRTLDDVVRIAGA